jgi:hypothetical protein
MSWHVGAKHFGTDFVVISHPCPIEMLGPATMIGHHPIWMNGGDRIFGVGAIAFHNMMMIAWSLAYIGASGGVLQWVWAKHLGDTLGYRPKI